MNAHVIVDRTASGPAGIGVICAFVEQSWMPSNVAPSWRDCTLTYAAERDTRKGWEVAGFALRLDGWSGGSRGACSLLSAMAFVGTAVRRADGFWINLRALMVLLYLILVVSTTWNC